MTNSKSRASINRRAAQLVALVVLIGSMFVPTIAEAGRKRVVILEMDGPKAEKFHSDLEKLIKRTHTVIPVDKWNSTAEEMDASSVSDKNVKKVAKKLKIDAVIQGKIEKRRDEYIIQIKVRAGKSGAIVGNRIDTKSDGPRIDAKASRDLKDELVDAIAGLDTNRITGGDDEEEEEEDKPKKKKSPKKDDEEDEEEDKPKKKKSFKNDDEEDEEEDKPAKKKSFKNDDEQEEEDKPKKGFSRKDDEEDPIAKSKKDEEEEEEEDKPKKDDEEEEDEDGNKNKKRTASRDGDDEEDGGEVEEGAETEGMTASKALVPGERAVDAVAGLSLNARRLSFTTSSDLADKPPPYKGVPVAGLLIDATLYPLAIGHKNKSMLKNIGVTAMYDKVIKINSKSGATVLPTTQARYAFGATFRYNFGKITAAGSLRYGRQNFTISSAMGVAPGIPNVNYTIIDPSVSVKIEVDPKIVLHANLGFMLFTNTGQIQNNDQYGPATVTGFEGEVGGDYMLTKNIFARAAFKFEVIGFKFNGSGALATGRDLDIEQDVFGASDKYLGGIATVGYLY